MTTSVRTSIEDFATDALVRWGLWQQGWRFVWDTRVHHRCGQCRPAEKRIALSDFMVKAPEEVWRDTVLHEVAHALDGCVSGHGRRWKMFCIQVGAKPERCIGGDLTWKPLPKNGWASDPCECGTRWTRIHRPESGAIYRCPKCRSKVVFQKVAG